MNMGDRAWIRLALLSVIAGAFLVMAGCAHEKAYKRGDRLSREGQYDQAVAELETAIRLAEDKNSEKAAEKYRKRLEQVKLEAGRFYHREAQIRLDRADLGGAQGFIERAIQFCPQDPTYGSLRERVVQAIAEAEKVRADALSLAEQRQWQAALQRMNEALAMYRTLPGGDADLKRIRDRAYHYYLDRAAERLHEGNLAEAESEAQAALVYQDGSEAKTILRTVKDRREAAVLTENGRKLLEQGRAEEALAALERAAKLHASHPEVSGLLSRARQAVCDGWLEQGRAAAEAHDYPMALRLFQKSQGLLDGYGGVAALLADVRSKLAGLHLEASQQYLQDGVAGIGAFHAAAGLTYLPGNPDAQRQLGRCSEQVRRDVSYTVAFTGFKAAPQQQSLGAILDAAVLEHLTKAHPANVMVVERTDLQAILGEQDLSKTDRIDPQSRVPTGQLQGVDALIVGQVLDSKVASDSKQTGYGESTYQDGYRREPNPDYIHAAEELDDAVGRLEHARRRLAEAEERLGRMRHPGPPSPDEMDRRRRAEAEVEEARHRLMHAAGEVGNAKMRLVSIPPEVLVPNMVLHRYPIETFTWTARVICMVKVLDTATGEVLIAEKVEGQAEHSDRMIQADAYRNVPADALELPSESTLIEGAANSAFGRLRQTLTEACAKHGQRFLVKMQRARVAGDAVEAVDNSVKYLFAYPGGDPQANAMVECIRAYLADEDGLIDVRALLRNHCHVLP
jgi:curli biogenesis system outer membrane secretion channel CsgG